MYIKPSHFQYQYSWFEGIMIFMIIGFYIIFERLNGIFILHDKVKIKLVKFKIWKTRQRGYAM
jgi:hypothetical protein